MSSIIENIKLTKIKITKFRSIHSAKIAIGDITVFSGKNNSGKSNVLKALNLFFNSQSGFKSDHNHEKDYNLAFTGQAGGKREIEITLHFQGGGNGALSNNFSISRKFQKNFIGEYEFWSSDKQVNNSIKNKDGNVIRQFTGFLNKLEYVYIPAIRDKNFVNELLLLFEKLLEDAKGKEFRNKIGNLSEILKNKSQDINKNFQKFIGLQSNASLSTSVVDVLKAIVINIDSEIRIQKKVNEGRVHPVEINLFSAGDGILMSYIPHFLAFICSKISNKKFIWGFEEPENSLEYSKAQDLSEKFYNDFKKYAQILITTHSPAFIKLKEKEDVFFYRVYIDPKDETQSTQYKTVSDIEKQLSLFPVKPEQYQYLQKELGFVEMSKEIESYLEKWRQDEKNKNKEISNLKEILKSSFPKKIFICEDKKGVSFWKKILRDNINNLEIISSNGFDNNIIENAFLYKMKEKNGYNPVIFRQIDRDGFTKDQIKQIEKNKRDKYNKYFKKYEIIALPVNELENFALITSENVKEFKDLVKKYGGNIEDKTRETMQGKLKTARKAFDYKNDDFGDNGITVTAMLNEARKNKLLFFKGKEIAKKKQRFSPIQYLKKVNQDQHPKKLNAYVKKIKKFYAN